MSELLDVSGVSVRFGGLTAVDGVSFSLAAGECRGLIGPNGAGKSTLFNAISGVTKPSEGRVVFDGRDVTFARPDVRAGHGIRRTFQTLQLMSDFTVLENVLVGSHLSIPSNPLLHLRGGRRSLDRQAVERAREVLRLLGLEELMLAKLESLTFGQQRFVEIARALVGNPKLLLLDEPAAGLSPAEVDNLGGLLKDLQTKRGLTILLVEHVLSLVMATCDRITVLDRGRVISEGTGAQVAADPVVRTAYLGEERQDA